jgi:outer membrane receptor protein involved in Fe transport
VFYHDYDRLMTNEVVSGPVPIVGPPAYLVLPVIQGNGMRGASYGATLDVKWQALDVWRLELQLSHIDFDLDLRRGHADVNALQVAGNSPEWQGAVHSYLELARGVSLFTGVRYVHDLPGQGVPSYVAVDVNMAWQVTPRLTASLAVHNLNDSRHPEFGDGNEIERSALVRIDWEF